MEDSKKGNAKHLSLLDLGENNGTMKFSDINDMLFIVKNKCKYKKGLGNAHTALCSTVL
jgi:hypothetical protein